MVNLHREDRIKPASVLERALTSRDSLKFRNLHFFMLFARLRIIRHSDPYFLPEEEMKASGVAPFRNVIGTNGSAAGVRKPAVLIRPSVPRLCEKPPHSSPRRGGSLSLTGRDPKEACLYCLGSSDTSVRRQFSTNQAFPRQTAAFEAP